MLLHGIGPVHLLVVLLGTGGLFGVTFSNWGSSTREADWSWKRFYAWSTVGMVVGGITFLLIQLVCGFLGLLFDFEPWDVVTFTMLLVLFTTFGILASRWGRGVHPSDYGLRWWGRPY